MLDGFLSRNTCVSSTQLNRPISNKSFFLHLEILIGRQYSFQKLTQFSHRNNVLDAPASELDGFLLRDKCDSSIRVNSLFGTKCAFLLLSKSSSILMGKTKC
jgi:hypothetical protein